MLNQESNFDKSHETVNEFLSRGGKIDVLPYYGKRKVEWSESDLVARQRLLENPSYREYISDHSDKLAHAILTNGIERVETIEVWGEKGAHGENIVRTVGNPLSQKWLRECRKPG